MPRFVEAPDLYTFRNKATVEEFVGRVNTKTESVSVAILGSPAGWLEPVQTPEFDEVSLVLTGELIVESGGETYVLGPEQAVLIEAGETVQYSSPKGARYVAICAPAFELKLANRGDWATVGGVTTDQD